MNNYHPFFTEANGKAKLPLNNVDEPAPIIFLRSPRERMMIPSTMDKIEFSVWVEKEPGEPHAKRFKTFHEYFGKPKFRPVDNISNEQMPAELKKLQEVMKEHHVIITTYTEVSDRDLYRFITKDLFSMLTTGEFYSTTKIVYEEFHPNREYLIKKAASDFIRLIFETYLGPYRMNHQKHSLQNYKEIKRILKTYDDNIALDYLEMDELSFDGDSACIIMELGFYGIMNDVFVHHYEGDCKCFLEKSGNTWRVTNCSLPDRIK
ncbi:MAG: hypothetical protein IPP71_08125 [Bacteroidetes bacterium]|nr:hypothetical protein [Bacteroidota bacterium]